MRWGARELLSEDAHRPTALNPLAADARQRETQTVKSSEVKQGGTLIRGSGRSGGLFRAAALGIAAMLVLTGCGTQIPSDPSGTLETVRGGTLRVGVSLNEGFVESGSTADDEPTGPEVEVIEAFAESLNADTEWTVGSEEDLVRRLERGQLDLVAGGLSDATPWVESAAVTRPYREVTDDDGGTRKIVMLTPMGENAFLSELETFLSAHGEGTGQ